MNDSLIIIMGVAMFTVIVLSLVFIILAARAQLVSTGKVKILINDEKTIETEAGGKLLQTLAANNIFLSSACGGGGTCAQCKCIVESGGGEMLPTEASHFTRREATAGWRLSCQTPVKQDMKIEVPEEVFGVKKWECTVESNPNVATFIKELTLKLPEGENVDFRAGGYVQLECPPHTVPWTRSARCRTCPSPGGTRAGTSSTSGATCPRSKSRSSVPIRWPTIRKRRASSSSTSAWPRRRPDVTISRRASCRPTCSA